MKYNTTEERLVLPEYGRNIQNMVNYCLTIEDRNERNRCANAIIQIMGNLFPHLRDVNDFKHILWDHLAIMGDFKLDVDYPYEVIQQDNLYKRPPRVEYGNAKIAYRHYGKLMEQMIQKANEMEDGPEKDALVKMLANFMKRSYLTWNKDSVDDRKIFKDLDELSDGKIVLSEESYKLTENKDITPRPISNQKKAFSRKGR
jgi:arsenate reductase-like glutaredoxin family protein